MKLELQALDDQSMNVACSFQFKFTQDSMRLLHKVGNMFLHYLLYIRLSLSIQSSSLPEPLSESDRTTINEMERASGLDTLIILIFVLGLLCIVFYIVLELCPPFCRSKPLHSKKRSRKKPGNGNDVAEPPNMM